jgi:hypothetical protein
MEKRTGLSKSQTNFSMSSRIMLALTQANCFRGAEPTEQYLRLFTARLEQENPDYLFQALAKLGERDREEGEPALLNLPMILKEIRYLTPKPKTRVEIDEEAYMEARRKAIRKVNSE